MKQLVKTPASEQLAEQLDAIAKYCTACSIAYTQATHDANAAEREQERARLDVSISGYMAEKRANSDRYKAWASAVDKSKALRKTQRLSVIRENSARRATWKTAQALLARLLLDNCDQLEGMNIRYKRTLKLIGDALPDGFTVYFRSEWGDLCLSSNRVRFDSEDYGIHLRNEEFGAEREREKLEMLITPGATPEQIEQQINGLKDAYTALSNAKDAYKQAVDSFNAATSTLRITACNDTDSVLRELGWCF